MTDPNSWGSEQLINTTTAGNQFGEVAGLAGGGYVAVWADQSGYIFGQVFDAAGDKVGSEINFTPGIAFGQSAPHVAGLESGGFALVWTGQANGSPHNAAQYAVYDATGTSLVAGGFVNDPPSDSSNYGTTVTALAGGGFAVGYEIVGSGGSDKSIAAQVFADDGSKSGSEVVLAADPTATAGHLAIGDVGGGQFAVTWDAEDAGDRNVYMRLVSDSGVALGSVITVNAGDSVQSESRVVGDGSGNFLVSFRDQGSQFGTPFQLAGQMFDATGTPLVPQGNDPANTAFLISDPVANGGTSVEPALIRLHGGGYMAAYVEWNGSNDIIVGQLLDSAGEKVGGEFLIKDPSGPGPVYEYQVSLGLLADGRVVVSWSDDSGDGGDTNAVGFYSQIVDPRFGQISGTGHAEVLFGSAGTVDDSMTGLGGNDTIHGQGGNDTIDGGAGDDSMDGGDGDDVYIVADAGDQVVEDSEHGGFDTIRTSIDFTLGAGVHVEQLILTGSGSHQLTGNDFDNTIHGGSGFDTLVGMGGNDSFMGDNSNVTMMGGAGNDTYLIGGMDETVVEVDGQGTDTVVVTSNYTLGIALENLILDGLADTGTGNALANRLTGNGLDNILNGLDGNDTLDGGVGNDTLKGGKGNDTYVLGSDHDTVSDTGGSDDRISSSITRKLASYGGIENLTLTGSGNVNGTGTAAANDLIGNDGNNALNGASGNDMLRGGRGFDLLTGGTGKDSFDFNAVAEIGTAAGLRDVIKDFHHGQDKIDLKTIDAIAGGANDAFKFVAKEGSHFTHHKGELVWDQQNHAGTSHDVTLVSGDIDADGHADFTIELSGIVALGKGDFVL